MLTIVEYEGKQTSIPTHYYKLFLAMSRKDRERIAALEEDNRRHCAALMTTALWEGLEEKCRLLEAENARLPHLLKLAFIAGSTLPAAGLVSDGVVEAEATKWARAALAQGE